MPAKTRFLILGAGTFILAAACSLTGALSGGAATVSATPHTGQPPAATPLSFTPSGPIAAAQGDLIRDGALRLVVNGWEEIKLGKEADSGKKFIAVDFSVVNGGSVAMDLFGMHGIWRLTDAQGNSYDPDFGANSWSNLERGGVIFPGDKVREDIVYPVPQAPTSMTFHYSNDRLPTIAPLSVTLKESPGISDPPDPLEGEIPAAVKTADQPLTVSNWRLQVMGVKVSQPCLMSHSQINCSPLPKDILSVNVDILQKNISSTPLSIYLAGMFWIQDPSGRRSLGGSESISSTGKPIEGGGEIRYTAAFLVRPNTPVLWLAFRYRFGETPARGDFVCITLPAATP